MMENVKVYGACENNLKNISVEIPKNKLVVFTGVSGSGKSSLVFDTIFAEAQSDFLESLSAYARGNIPRISKPDVDKIENLNPCIVIDQRPMGRNPRSTVGTATDLYTYIRLLFSRMGDSGLDASDFSFNRPSGACENCRGLGVALMPNLTKLINVEKSLNGGAVLHRTWKVGSRYWAIMKNSGFFDMDKKVKDFSEDEMHKLLYNESVKITNKADGFVQDFSYAGLFTRLLKRQNDSRGLTGNSYDTQFMVKQECHVCRGSRVNERVRSVMLKGKNIVDLTNMEFTELYEFLNKLDGKVAQTILPFIQKQLKHLIDIGLGYLNLNRGIATLSGGEAQRLKLAKQLGNSLTGLIYILDEPTAGLHTRDVSKLISILQHLRDKGNSVFVVEHNPKMMSSADYIIDMGPKSGNAGGDITATGTPKEIIKGSTLTGAYLSGRKTVSRDKKAKAEVLSYKKLSVKNASLHNLKNITVQFPQQSFIALIGVSGSGKSSLIEELISQNPEAIVVDQKPVGLNVRSIPATYTKSFDEMRKEFAKATGINPAMLSFNGKGACENCKGLGHTIMDMHFLGSIREICPVCRGQRYHADVLKHVYQEKNIADILNMTIADAIEFFQSKKITHSLNILSDVGLDYLTLGQPLSTLSGGEVQRVKLASNLKKEGEVYILDEPTSGLHMSDVNKLLQVLDSLVKNGNTVIVVEHNLDMIRNADWIIELGPEAGLAGGQVVFEGSLDDIFKSAKSNTKAFLGYSTI
ncbi:MAG: excinuclease ABC subunit UvrA [Proteobacteria bacterium]|nr:excinuclease ABC subunit UvrA [Pseudomonadota bacterium]